MSMHITPNLLTDNLSYLCSSGQGGKQKKTRLYKSLLVGRILRSKPLLLPAVGRDRQQRSVAESLPSRRQDIWGVVAELSYLDIYRRGWVGRACSANR